MIDPKTIALACIRDGDPIPPAALALLDPAWVAELTRPRTLPDGLPELISGQPRKGPHQASHTTAYLQMMGCPIEEN